jgi:SSS family solute:Na+ symporter
MPLPPRQTAAALGAAIFSLAGSVVCGADAADAAALRTRAMQVLRHELATTAGFVRVHAAEALIEHGQTEGVAALYLADLATATPPYRIGVWRVLARVAKTPGERDAWIGRIRAALRDPAGLDRVHAAETLAKLAGAQPADRAVIDAWLATADAPTSAYLRWVRVQLAAPAQRAEEELTLVALLRSEHPDARLRSAYALARLPSLAPETIRRLHAAATTEPADSKARAYLLSAALLHSTNDQISAPQLSTALRAYLERGTVGEKFEVAPTLGRRGNTTEIPTLLRLLDSTDADPRIGAASGLLHLVR